ncbi:MAG: DMT family transporter [Methyloligellaceae bacterium]
MDVLWIPISLTAGFMQAVRTAAQKSLNAHLSTLVTTYVRSLFGLPLMVVFLWVVMASGSEPWPELHGTFLFHAFAAAMTQVIGTVLLIRLFTLRNFAVGTTLTKTDVMMTAIVGSVLFSESITALGWVAMLLTVAGVILISVARMRTHAFGQTGGGVAAALASRSTRIGLATGFVFCLSYLFLREASLSLASGGVLHRAAWTVVAVTAIQVVTLGAWLLLRDPQGLIRMLAAWRLCSFVGITSAIGSICWFTAMTIQNASYVKAVGQIETAFTLAISYLYFNERLNWPELLGIAVIVAGVLLFLL